MYFYLCSINIWRRYNYSDWHSRILFVSFCRKKDFNVFQHRTVVLSHQTSRRSWTILQYESILRYELHVINNILNTVRSSLKWLEIERNVVLEKKSIFWNLFYSFLRIRVSDIFQIAICCKKILRFWSY